MTVFIGHNWLSCEISPMMPIKVYQDPKDTVKSIIQIGLVSAKHVLCFTDILCPNLPSLCFFFFFFTQSL